MVEDCCDTYRKNLRSECHQEIITKDTEFPRASVLIGGPPCQPFSRRGKRKGQIDDRNGFPAFIEAVKKFNPIYGCVKMLRGYLNKVLRIFSR